MDFQHYSFGHAAPYSFNDVRGAPLYRAYPGAGVEFQNKAFFSLPIPELIEAYKTHTGAFEGTPKTSQDHFHFRIRKPWPDLGQGFTIGGAGLTRCRYLHFTSETGAHVL